MLGGPLSVRSAALEGIMPQKLLAGGGGPAERNLDPPPGGDEHEAQDDALAGQGVHVRGVAHRVLEDEGIADDPHALAVAAVEERGIVDSGPHAALVVGGLKKFLETIKIFLLRKI